MDPILFDRSYFLQPHQIALGAYSLLRDAMTDTGRIGLGRVAIRTRERLALLRPYGPGISLVTLLWPEEVREPDFGWLTDQTPQPREQEQRMAEQLVLSLIPDNPVRPQRRGKQRHRDARRRESLWATPEQVLTIALQAATHAWPGAGILMITAAYTGARWGELTGLQRHNTHLNDARITIDPEHGALHEINGTLTLGPPKTEDSARTISLPPFLTELLQHHLTTHDHPHVFVTPDHQLLRRSNYARRAMRPATDGTLHHPNPHQKLQPVVPGLTFHGLRHSHKTWLIADAIPQIAQARRMGHVLPDKIEHIYSHVATEVENKLLNALQQRWQTALKTITRTNCTQQATPSLEALAPPS